MRPFLFYEKRVLITGPISPSVQQAAVQHYLSGCSPPIASFSSSLCSQYTSVSAKNPVKYYLLVLGTPSCRRPPQTTCGRRDPGTGVPSGILGTLGWGVGGGGHLVLEVLGGLGRWGRQWHCLSCGTVICQRKCPNKCKGNCQSHTVWGPPTTQRNYSKAS